MLVCGLFSGVGGFELAFSQVGFSTSMLVEIDPAASHVLRARFPDCDLRSDIADVAELPSGTSVVTAGFPCQNLSMAGDKSGIDGTKSGIIGKMFELIARSDVPTVVIENVYFMLQLDRGNGMRRLAEEFERLGFRWAYRVIDTMGFGLPHRRRRVYMVASKALDPRGVLFADDSEYTPANGIDLTLPVGFYWTEGRSGVGLTVDGIPPLKVGSTLGILSAPAVLFPDGEVLMPSLRACEQLQGFPAGWIDLSDIGCVPKRRPEWRLIGNAISVPAARWVAERIRKPGNVLDFEVREISGDRRWPDAGWNVDGKRVAVLAGDRPVANPAKSIGSYRDADWTRLSDRALDGFVRRAEEGGLRMPIGFLEALRNAERKKLKAA
jgi:DNA (cytosine-5)-methyltransferase 1